MKDTYLVVIKGKYGAWEHKFSSLKLAKADAKDLNKGEKATIYKVKYEEIK